MRPSEITTNYIKSFLRIDDLDEESQAIVDGELESMLTAAIKYAESYTGLPVVSEEGEPSLDDYSDITIAILGIVADMYETRTANIDKQTYQNRTVECILSMHSYNLV